MTIKLTDIKYDLYDPETNPNDDIANKDLDLPDDLTVNQNTIDEHFEWFDPKRDLFELVFNLTGFEMKSYGHLDLQLT